MPFSFVLRFVLQTARVPWIGDHEARQAIAFPSHPASVVATAAAPAARVPCPFFQRTALMQFWLMKSEPDEASIDDLAAAPKHTLPWTGVRNYQARNFMRDTMRIGDGVLFYHSSCPEPGIAGLAEVSSTPYPDPTQFDPASPYHDPKSKREEPRWSLVDVRFVKKTPLIPLAALREHDELAEMRVLVRGNRLSITPVTRAEWKFITEKLMK
jgi:predicted RNA-binding protein with PUA-like domain